MSTTIISDKYGNMKRISDNPDNITLVRDITDNRKKIISDRHTGSDSIMSASVNRNYWTNEIKPSNVGIIENKKNISYRPSGSDSVMSASINKPNRQITKSIVKETIENVNKIAKESSKEPIEDKTLDTAPEKVSPEKVLPEKVPGIDNNKKLNKIVIKAVDNKKITRGSIYQKKTTPVK